MKLTVKPVVLALILMFVPAVALAGLSDQVRDDFATVSGVVVMPINDEYIVDLDARDNLNIGDILTLVKPGKKIFHPETKEVIGSVDDVAGFLQVTRISSGYSYARVLTAGLQPDNSAPVKRFEQVPAILQTGEQSDLELARQLQFNLPQLNWLQDSQKDQALLVFNLQEKALDVKTAQGDALHKYQITGDQQLTSTAMSSSRPAVSPQTAPKPKLLQQLANSVMGTVTQTNEELFAEIDEAIIRKKQLDRKGIWLGPNLAGHPIGLVVADLDGDGQQEVAIALEDRIQIARISDGKFAELASVTKPAALELLGIGAFDADGNGLPELYVSALGASRPASFAIEYDGSGYRFVIRSVRWLLRAMTLPGGAGPELVGQRLGAIGKIFGDSSKSFGDSNRVFSGPLFRVQRRGDELVEGEPVALPTELNLFNFTPLTDANGLLGFVYLTTDDYLKVISNTGEQLWGSSDYFGGSETCFTLDKHMRDEMQIPTCMPMNIIAMPNNEILVAQNDGQRIVERYRKFQPSRVVSLQWNGFAMTENWRTSSQQGYLGDFALADADNDGSSELVMVVKFQHKGVIDEARSSVVIYEME